MGYLEIKLFEWILGVLDAELSTDIQTHWKRYFDDFSLITQYFKWFNTIHDGEESQGTSIFRPTYHKKLVMHIIHGNSTDLRGNLPLFDPIFCLPLLIENLMILKFTNSILPRLGTHFESHCSYKISLVL